MNVLLARQQGGEEINRNGPVWRDVAAAEFDGGNVTFASGPEAHDEPESAGGYSFLVRVRDDGGIEKCGGFERVFA